MGGTFWPPAGIVLAALLVAPRRTWAQLLVAALIANFVSDAIHSQTLAASTGFALANLGEPLVGALLLGRFCKAPVTFTRLPEIVALALVVAFASAPLGAAIGALAAEWWTQDPPGFIAGWRTWWIGDAVGALVLTPAVVRVITDIRKVGAVCQRA